VVSDSVDINRAHWDELAQLHGQDDYYDTEALLAGADTLSDDEQAALVRAVGSVAGLDVIHIQCHIGFDTISLARRGARVTGVDFSSESLAKAKGLAAAAGVSIDWVQADATALPAKLRSRFDLAYSTIGVLCWISDIDAWMRSAASVLRPGGRLVLIDIHPLLNMLAETDPLRIDFPYAFRGALRFDDDGSYALPEAHVEASETVQFAHSIGEVVNAAIAAGLRIELLIEHLDAGIAPRPFLLNREQDGRLRLRIDGQELPVLFTLLASLPPA
jgi:SAM-dependent methyltransferase